MFCEAYKTVFCEAYKTAFCLDAKERRNHTLCATLLSEHFPNMEHVCAITCGGGVGFTAEAGPTQHLAVALKRRGVNSFSPLPSRGAVLRTSFLLSMNRGLDLRRHSAQVKLYCTENIVVAPSSLVPPPHATGCTFGLNDLRRTLG